MALGPWAVQSQGRGDEDGVRDLITKDLGLPSRILASACSSGGVWKAWSFLVWGRVRFMLQEERGGDSPGNDEGARGGRVSCNSHHHFQKALHSFFFPSLFL